MCWGDSERTRFGVGRTADLGPGEEARGVPGFPRHTHLASLPCLGRVRTPPVRSRPPQASVSRPPRHSGPGSRLTAPPGWCPPREGPRVRGPRLRRREDSSVSGAEASTWQPPRPQLCAEPGLGYTRSTSSPRRPPPNADQQKEPPATVPGGKGGDRGLCRRHPRPQPRFWPPQPTAPCLLLGLAGADGAGTPVTQGGGACSWQCGRPGFWGARGPQRVHAGWPDPPVGTQHTLMGGGVSVF